MLCVNNITGTLPKSWSSMSQASTSTLAFLLEICEREGNAATLRCSPVLKQNKLLLQVKALGFGNNQLEGSLPESWGNLTSVRHCFDVLTQLHPVGVAQMLQQNVRCA